ncbi:MAG TPA: amino acid racemase [Thermoanaerobaculia bacterium]|nr:amino acid racemase [Thermoanaerobaculia bacterium]
MSGRAKHIGIAGVTSEGALLCVRTIQNLAETRLPADLRPEVSLHLHPFPEYFGALSRGDWPTIVALLVGSIGKLHSIGAEFAIIPANVVHFSFDEIARAAPIPLLSLVEATAGESEERGYRKVAVLGTRWTMRDGLYEAPLRRRGIEPVVPDEAEQVAIQSIIEHELIAGQVRAASTARLLAVVSRLAAAGCQAMVLACTELPLALNEANCGVPVIDTTRLLGERALAHSQPSQASQASQP